MLKETKATIAAEIHMSSKPFDQLPLPVLHIVKFLRTLKKDMMPTCVYYLLLSFFIASCGTPKLLKEHLETDNIASLISDYHELKPKYKTKITQHIFSQHDFSKDSYGTLVNYRDKCNDILLAESFDSVVSMREGQILEHLDNCGDVNCVADYYRSHSDEQPFLCPVISATLTQNIEDYDYIDVRTMYRAFKGTK